MHLTLNLEPDTLPRSRDPETVSLTVQDQLRTYWALRSQPSFFISAHSQRCSEVRRVAGMSANSMPCWPSLLIQATRPSISVSLLLPGMEKQSDTGAPKRSGRSVLM